MDQRLPSQLPGTECITVPEQYRDHPLLSTAPYFTLPNKLLTRVVAEVGEDRFDPDVLKMDYELSDVLEDHSSYIGFWGGRPIGFLLLRAQSDLASESLVRGMAQWGKSAEEARAILALGGQRLDWTADVRRAYCGWLMTNPAFLAEHWQVFETWANQVALHGVPQMGPVVRDAQAVPDAQLAKGKMQQSIRAFEEFFIRWRLEGMPAPFVPQPMGMHLPVMDLRPVLGHMRQGGTVFYIPDICPIPSRDKIREILEEALRDRSGPDHLLEWFEIVHSDNVAKNQIPHYARIFEVQHYMRVLYTRHAVALERKKSALMLAFSAYLGVSDDTVERDAGLIADRLGRDWHLCST